MVLLGHEVKSIRTGHAGLKGAFVTFHGDEAYLTNAHISPYRHARVAAGYAPEHSRKLLLRKKQIDYLRGKAQEQGLTIIPLSIYTRGPRIKVEVAVARGKKKYDKRATIRKREQEREIQRKIKEL